MSSRLTRKNYIGIIPLVWDENELSEQQKGILLERKAYNKLYELEDIEEELGIDLITLFKAFKNGFYFISREDNELYFADPDNEDCGIECYNRSINGWGITWAGLGVAYTDDYGKTWSLGKNDLINK